MLRFQKFSKRAGHSLVVPYNHQPIQKFVKGVPSKQARPLLDQEKTWDFWTTSPAFHGLQPIARGLVQVPVGEQWVIESFGKYKKTCSHGNHFLMPFFDKVKTVKHSTLSAMGVFSQVDGKDVYAIAYFQVTNAAQSAYFVDPESGKLDSERTAAKAIKFALGEAIRANEDVPQRVLSALKAKQSDWGLEFLSVELRGSFDASENVPAKIRAYDPPMPNYDTPGHDLDADYWSSALTPGFFYKATFGSTKRPKDSTVPSLEWCIPSPPDFHHFNMQPKVAVGPELEELEKLEAKH